MIDVMLFVHPKVDNFWNNPLFSIATKKKWEEEREWEYNESMWERVVQSCPFFGCTNIIIDC
jgi:hypothetical protein